MDLIIIALIIILTAGAVINTTLVEDARKEQIREEERIREEVRRGQ